VSGRASLDEMRGLLGALRSDQRAARVPRPTLAGLDALLARARADGRVIELDVSGERRSCRPATSSSTRMCCVGWRQAV